MQERIVQLVVSDLEERLQMLRRHYQALSEDHKLLVPNAEELFGVVAARVRRTSVGERGWLAWNSGLALTKLHELEQMLGESVPSVSEWRRGESVAEYQRWLDSLRPGDQVIIAPTARAQGSGSIGVVSVEQLRRILTIVREA